MGRVGSSPTACTISLSTARTVLALFWLGSSHLTVYHSGLFSWLFSFVDGLSASSLLLTPVELAFDKEMVPLLFRMWAPLRGRSCLLSQTHFKAQPLNSLFCHLEIYCGCFSFLYFYFLIFWGEAWGVGSQGVFSWW